MSHAPGDLVKIKNYPVTWEGVDPNGRLGTVVRVGSTFVTVRLDGDPYHIWVFDPSQVVLV